jgi:hypothetical protein
MLQYPSHPHHLLCYAVLYTLQQGITLLQQASLDAVCSRSNSYPAAPTCARFRTSPNPCVHCHGC